MIEGLVVAIAFLTLAKGKQVVAKVTSGRPFLTKPWYNHLISRARFHRIPETIALSLVKQESGGNEKAIGSAGEIGLLQLKQAVAIDYIRVNGLAVNIKDVGDNIEAGLWYLSWLRDKWRLSLPDALLAYNSGIGNFQDGDIQNPKYASQIIDRASQWT